MSSGESSTATAAPSQPSLAFTPEELKQWFEDHGQLEAGATSLDFGFGGSDFGDLVASGEGKAALEELGVAAVLQRHKIVSTGNVCQQHIQFGMAHHIIHTTMTFSQMHGWTNSCTRSLTPSTVTMMDAFQKMRF